MTREEIEELNDYQRLGEMTDHPCAIKSQVCNSDHSAIIYESINCPVCVLQCEVDQKDREIRDTETQRDAFEEKFDDEEQERSDLQIEYDTIETERDELRELVRYAREHCPEASI